MARSPQERSGATLTTGDLSRLTRIPQQTLIAWDRSGLLKARIRRGSRSSPRARRLYDQNGLIAGLFAKSATRMGLKGKQLREMIGLVQSGDRTALKAAVVFTYRNGPGLMTHFFTPDVKSEDIRRYLKWLRQHGALVEEPTSLWTIYQHLAPSARKLMRMGEDAVPLIESIFETMHGERMMDLLPLRRAARELGAIEQEDKT